MGARSISSGLPHEAAPIERATEASRCVFLKIRPPLVLLHIANVSESCFTTFWPLRSFLAPQTMKQWCMMFYVACAVLRRLPGVRLTDKDLPEKISCMLQAKADALSDTRRQWKMRASHSYSNNGTRNLRQGAASELQCGRRLLGRLSAAWKIADPLPVAKNMRIERLKPR